MKRPTDQSKLGMRRAEKTNARKPPHVPVSFPDTVPTRRLKDGDRLARVEEAGKRIRKILDESDL